MGDEQVLESGSAAELGQQQEVTTDNQNGEQSVEHEGKITQEIFNREMNKKAVKIHEANTKTQGLEKKLFELEQKLTGLQVTSAPVVPPIPDQYGEDFDRKMRERDTAVALKNTYDNEQVSLRRSQEDVQHKTQAKEKDTKQKVADGFDARTRELGIESSEMNTAVSTVLSYGITEGLATYIAQDSDGPLILKHLASNPMQLSELVNMDPMSAAVKVSTEIRAEAQKLKPKQSQTPDPGVIIKGSGAAPGEHPAVRAATFE